jgi:hypothetical protein
MTRCNRNLAAFNEKAIPLYLDAHVEVIDLIEQLAGKWSRR